ncbi:MAG TPA: DinB family protein, partial [Candidatus Acidoferrum sp.]
MTGPTGQTEPWLRGTHSDVADVPRAAMHAFEQAGEDVTLWCAELTDAELNATPYGLPSIAFQLVHIAGSLDRLLTYAEGRSLDEQQLAALKSE